MAIKSYNGVTYDDSVDYSAAIEQAKATGQDTSALEAAREAKIGGKYGGEEPTMYGSNQTYSQVRNDNSDAARQTISNAVKTSSQVNGYDYSAPSNISTNNDDYYTSYGAANGANMGRNPALAGMSVKQGQYTVTYNELGYATKAVKDGGASATGAIATSHANDSVYHQLAYQAAAAGDWDTVGRYLNLIADTYSRTGPATAEDTGVNMKAANLYGAELQNQFKYNATDYYNKLYDQAYGAGSAAAFDATGGAIKTYADLVAAMGAEAAKQVVAAHQTQTGGNGNAGVAANNAATMLSAGAVSNPYGSYDDMTRYINDMYAQSLEAELAALKSAYDSNVAELESQNDRIAEQYRAARNQSAGQNELQRMQMNELGIAQGLNTGTSGQLALAQNMAYQNNLGNLWAQEAQDKAESDRMMAEMLRDYNASVNQATATSNAQLAQALYNEMIRQQEMEAQNAKNELAALTNKAEMLAAFGDFSGYKALGYSDAEIAMMTDTYQKQLLAEQQAQAAKNAPKAKEYTPPLTYAQMTEEIALGNITPGVVESYEYYHKTPYVASEDVGAMPEARYQEYEDAIIKGIQRGNTTNATNIIDSIWNKLSTNQQNRLNQTLYNTYGTNYTP